MKVTKAILLPLMSFLLSCSVTQRSGSGKHIYIQKNNRENKQWKLVWEESFDGNSLDTSKWTIIPPGTSDWNRHMSSHDSCFALREGLLYLRGIQNPDPNTDQRPFLTGGIWTKGKFAFQYGRIEIRAKLESAQGAWPAIWMLAELDKYGESRRHHLSNHAFLLHLKSEEKRYSSAFRHCEN